MNANAKLIQDSVAGIVCPYVCDFHHAAAVKKRSVDIRLFYRHLADLTVLFKTVQMSEANFEK